MAKPMRCVQRARTRKTIKLIQWRYLPKTEEWEKLRATLQFCTVRRQDIVVRREFDSIPMRFSKKDGELSTTSRPIFETHNYTYSVDLDSLRNYDPDVRSLDN